MFDLHIHSEYSGDSSSPVKEILRVAKLRGLRMISITDHGTVEGSLKAMQLSRRIKVIPGQEIKTKQGEILVYGLEWDLSEGHNLRKTCQKVKRSEGYIVIPHPLDPTRFSVRKSLFQVLDLIDGIEIHNSRTPAPFNHYARKVSARFGIPGFAGSDAHMLSEIGKAVSDAEGNPPFGKQVRIIKKQYSLLPRIGGFIYKLFHI